MLTINKLLLSLNIHVKITGKSIRNSFWINETFGITFKTTFGYKHTTKQKFWTYFSIRTNINSSQWNTCLFWVRTLAWQNENIDGFLNKELNCLVKMFTWNHTSNIHKEKRYLKIFLVNEKHVFCCRSFLHDFTQYIWLYCYRYNKKSKFNKFKKLSYYGSHLKVPFLLEKHCGIYY